MFILAPQIQLNYVLLQPSFVLDVILHKLVHFVDFCFCQFCFFFFIIKPYMYELFYFKARYQCFTLFKHYFCCQFLQTKIYTYSGTP